MKILFTTTHAHLPLFYGGSEISTDTLAKMFLSMGHEVAVHSGLRRKRGLMPWWLRAKAKLGSPATPTDRIMGYPTYRSWRAETVLPDAIWTERPDVAIVQAGHQDKLVKICLDMKLAPVVYLRDTRFVVLKGMENTLSRISCVANSSFTAREFYKRTGKQVDVVPPLVRRQDYENPRPGQQVLFVNPNHQKGVDVVVTLAERNTDVSFLFVEGWGLPREFENRVFERTRKLRNVTWLPSTSNMKSIYAKARIVLCPSGTPFEGEEMDCVEAWGRVATEAQFSGIPVIATNDGGLPESVGDGGILVERDAPIEAWEEALRLLWDDDRQYRAYSERARQRSYRADIQPDIIAATLLDVCRRAASSAT